MSVVWVLQGVVPHGEREKLTPGVEIEENPMFGFWDCFMELIANPPVSDTKSIVPSHLEVFFRYMQNEQLNEINDRKSLLHKRVVFVFIVMESYRPPTVGIGPGRNNDRVVKVTTDILNDRFWIVGTGHGANVESISVPMVDSGFHLFKRRTDVFFQFIQQNSPKGFTEVGIIEMCDLAPGTIIREPTFSKETANVMWC